MFDKQQLCLNGTFISGEQMKFFAENRAFLYGDSLFETMFVSKGKIHFFNEHVDRLLKGAEILHYTVPNIFTVFRYKLEEQILSLIIKNKIYKSSVVRLTVFRKPGGLYTPETNDVEYLISVKEVKNTYYELNSAGLFTGLYSAMTKPINILSPFKTGNSLLYTLAGLYKKVQKLDDCLICNNKGNIIEATSSNLFLVMNDTLITSPLEEGCVNGIMRKQILMLAQKNGIAKKEQIVTTDLMYKAEEVFLTNSVSGIQWVVAFKEKRYFKKYSNFFVNKLNDLFR